MKSVGDGCLVAVVAAAVSIVPSFLDVPSPGQFFYLPLLLLIIYFCGSWLQLFIVVGVNNVERNNLGAGRSTPVAPPRRDEQPASGSKKGGLEHFCHFCHFSGACVWSSLPSFESMTQSSEFTPRI